MSFQHMRGMGDPLLKARMLRSLLRDCLPDETRRLGSNDELVAVTSLIKTHGLLSEAHPFPADRKLVDAWKSAVDTWVERILSLIDSNAPEKCWVGIWMLHVTCEECSSDRLVVSYPVWFQKLLPSIQPSCTMQLLKVASCASMTNLFTRLARFPNLKKDATSLAGKLIQSLLQLINEDDATEAEGALDLLGALITFFPSSMHRHQGNIEAVLVSKIMSGKINANMSKKFACSLALLPKVRGDGDSWFSMMQKILITLNMLITDAFQGLEEENKRSEVVRLLVQPGKDPPPPLGGQLMLGESSELGTNRLQKIIIPRVSALMHACCVMLTNPYPVQVIVPVRPLLAIIARVLAVDGSLDESLFPFVTALQQEVLCSVLPALHLDSLELLIAIIKGLRSHLLGNAATVIRLLTDYFRRAALPSPRVKIYYIMQILLDSMGVGVAVYLAQEVINNAFIDLSDFVGSGAKTFNTHSPKLVNGALVQDNQRKRKHALGSSLEPSSSIGVEVEAGNIKPVTSVSVKIAALRALESLLTVAGSLKSECWRSDVDLLLLNVATSACDAGWDYEGKCTILTEEHTSSRAEFQLAAFKALLASLLSPAHVRPPYLSQGLELFHRGKLESGTELAGFCAHALLTVHVLIHPRALPLVNFPDTRLTEKSGGNRLEMSMFSTSNIGVESVDDVDDDEFYNTLLENNEETEVDVNNQRMDIAVDDSPEENHQQMNSAAFHEITEGKQSSFTAVAELQSLDREANNAQLNENPGNQDVALTSDPSASVHPDASKSLAIDLSSNEPAVSKTDNVSTGASGSMEDLEYASEMLTLDAGRKEIALQHGSDSDMDSLPDIVDADPDSD